MLLILLCIIYKLCFITGVCVYYRVQSYLCFQASIGDLGMYFLWVKGDYCINVKNEKGNTTADSTDNNRKTKELYYLCQYMTIYMKLTYFLNDPIISNDPIRKMEFKGLYIKWRNWIYIYKPWNKDNSRPRLLRLKRWERYS